MNELRFVRREERSLILANESDDEFRLVIDDLLISELKHAGRKEREGSKVRPREIQSLVRAGHSRAEIAALTGLEEADIERYEEPVLAERRYILDRAHAVQVRTEESEEIVQKFGEVITERLIGIEAEATDWTAWRDEETGWLVSLEFISRDVAHRALWSFDHRKQTLAPINSDAVNLSKQGEVGDRLIPKLRAVDNGDRTSQFAPVADQTTAHASEELQPATAPSDSFAAQTPTTPTEEQQAARSTPGQEPAESTRVPAADVNAEYVRRREIDQRAIKSDDAGPVDFSQTADLLDALRRRRGERQRAETQDPDDAATTPIESVVPEIPAAPTAPESEPATSAPAPERAVKKPRSIWGGAGVASGVTATPTAGAGSGPRASLVPEPPQNPRDAGPQSRLPQAAETAPQAPVTPQSNTAPQQAKAPASPAVPTKPTEDARAPKKGRASIPSWDDILFGTRSDEDPAQ